MEHLVLLGATGSIGQQTLEVIRQHPTLFKLYGVSAGNNITALISIITEFKPEHVCVKEVADMAKLARTFPGTKFYFGEKGLEQLATLAKTTKLINALIGFVGLKPTLLAIEAGIDIALANKETLVVAGKLVTELAQKHQVKLLPIDSEHSAIFQCLQGNQTKDVRQLIITASGGSFRQKKRSELKDVSVKEALAHPNWQMGAKITIDSATMMNKGLEVIEAHWLFNLPYEKISVLLHPESIVHSLVEFIDNSLLAQLGTANMLVPIQYALTYPKRYPLAITETLDLAKVATLNFSELDQTRFPFIKLAYQVGEKGGNLPAIMNGANEAAVALFLAEKIDFLKIEELVFAACKNLPFIAEPTLAEIIAADQAARTFVLASVKE